MALHHENIFNCESCEKTFTRPHLLKHHFAKYHVSKKCNICETEYSSQATLRKHVIKIHEKTKVNHTAIMSKDDRIAKLSEINKRKDHNNYEEICQICNKSYRLSTIIPHLLRFSPNCKNRYPTEELDALMERCKKYKKLIKCIGTLRRYHKAMLKRNEKLCQKAEEQSVAYNDQYLPLLKKVV